MPTKRNILGELKREELQAAVEHYELEVVDRRVFDHLIDALAKSKRARLGEILGTLSRDRLKGVCTGLGLDDSGREKSVIIDRLCGDPRASDARDSKDGEDGHVEERTVTVTKRDIVERLMRDELQVAVEVYGLEVADRRVREDLIDAVVRSKRARIAQILGAMSRDRLKDICAGLGVDDSGREKSIIIDRLCGDKGALDVVDRSETTVDTAGLLARLLSESLGVSDPGVGWPTLGTLTIAQREHEVSIYARVVGGSSRGNTLERRFQNPSQQSPISDDPNRYELLFGLWIEQGEERAVIVAFDAFRRMDKTTRFSMFMPLSLLEQAADTGFATHDNTRGETVYAFRPENIGRYVEAMVAAGTWMLQRPEAAPPSVRHADTVAAPTLRQTVTSIAGDTIYIRPRVGMYAAFARLNYKPWFALAEFLDNSIQSFLGHRDALIADGHDGPLVIDVNLDDNEISVTDRAGGIAWKDFPRAFSPAAPPDDPSGLSEFGLGMKAAACWFSRRWTVRTSALGEPIERTVMFDVPKISREGLENLPIESRPARPSDHFTSVTMHDLRVHPRGRTLTKIKTHLSSIYRVLMQDGVVKIRVTTNGNTEELAYAQPEILVAPHFSKRTGPPLVWKAYFAHDLGDKRVSGWAGVLKTGNHSVAGFSVFRRRRLVEGSIGETYKPHLIFGSPNSFASQRIVGEIFVDGFDVTHTKDGIQWHGYEDVVLESIARQIDSPRLPLLEQADGYRARKTAASLPSDFGADALEATAAALELPQQVLDVTAQEPIEPSLAPPSQATQPLQQREFRMNVFRDAKPWVVHLALTADVGAPFYTTSVVKLEGGEDVVSVRINLEHEFSIAYINDNEGALQPILRLLASLAVAEKVARDAGVRNPGVVRTTANEILRTITIEGGE